MDRPRSFSRSLILVLQVRFFHVHDSNVSAAFAERIKLSPLVGAWYSELGGLNKWCHIWAYKDAGERFRIREEARAKGIWPPKGGQPGMMLKQENMLVVPASFSPLR